MSIENATRQVASQTVRELLEHAPLEQVNQPPPAIEDSAPDGSGGAAHAPAEQTGEEPDMLHAHTQDLTALVRQREIAGKTADELLASWKPGVYPEGPSLAEVARGAGTLTINQGGEGVRELQEKLNALGAQPPLEVDGKLGPKTFAALRAQQRALGLDDTGVLDAATLAAIERAPRPAGGGPGQVPGGGPAPATPGEVGPAQGGPPAPIGPSTPLPFTPNPAALEAARRSATAKDLAARTQKFAAIYREASEKTGVPPEMIAAIHFNESHQSLSKGPESGFGLDPRYTSTAAGNAILEKYGMAPWERGAGTERATLQSAIIAAELLKKSAAAVGVAIGPNMTQNEMAAAITAYGAGAKAGRKALETGRSFLFDPSDSQPHVRHPGGTSIGENGETIAVPPGIKQGLLRWDVLLPLMKEQLGGGPAEPAEIAFAPGGPGQIGPAQGSGGPGGAGPTQGPGPTGGAVGARATGIPPRPPNAETGSEFAKRIMNMRGPERERAILEEIEKGNVPDFLRNLKPVTTTFRGPDGKTHTATYYVMPDYISIGSNEDNIRIPMSAITAQKIADKFGMTLPTAKMVDDIYASAQTKLVASPRDDWKYGDGRMQSTASYLAHDRTIDEQLGGRQPEGIVAGHKKDVIISNGLEQNPGKLAFYGWYDANGRPIQGAPGRASFAHEPSYADYSHGVRLVSGTIVIDGRPMTMEEAMRDPVYSRAVSNEGPIRNPRIPGVARS
jgi:peptidoglycan hydrolase-like protein with peptidoglycan-binding domain